MKITIKYFGQLAEVKGIEDEVLEFQQSSLLLCDLEKLLISKNKNLENFTYKIAVNQLIVENNYLIKNNDEIAILPPFSGG